jgi:hypothetical protein
VAFNPTSRLDASERNETKGRHMPKKLEHMASATRRRPPLLVDSEFVTIFDHEPVVFQMAVKSYKAAEFITDARIEYPVITDHGFDVVSCMPEANRKLIALYRKRNTDEKYHSRRYQPYETSFVTVAQAFPKSYLYHGFLPPHGVHMANHERR